jgi:hypothetical protein
METQSDGDFRTMSNMDDVLFEEDEDDGPLRLIM